MITSPTAELSPTRSRSQSPKTSIHLPSSGQQEMTLETLSRFSASGLVSLARSKEPPTDLSRPPYVSPAVWTAKIESVDAFLLTLGGMKPSLQKQKIGERIFRLFKTAKVRNLDTGELGTMKNVSKKTVSLLDGEDLPSLAHLCEEFPDVLIAKAAAMEI